MAVFIGRVVVNFDELLFSFKVNVLNTDKIGYCE